MKICFKTNIKILTEPPKVPYSSLKYTAFTKALLYANTKIAFSKIKTIELLCSLEEQPLSYLYCWPKGLRDHLRERRLCNYVIMFSHTALTLTSAFLQERGANKTAQQRKNIYIYKYQQWALTENVIICISLFPSLFLSLSLSSILLFGVFVIKTNSQCSPSSLWLITNNISILINGPLFFHYFNRCYSQKSF